MAQVGANMEYQEYKWAYSIMDSSKVSACLISMLLIVYGSFRSLNMEREARERAEREREATLLGGKPATTSSNSNSNVQTLNTMQALCFPLGSSVALLIMFFFFDSMQTLVAICTAIIACAALAFLLTPLCQYVAGGARGAVCGRYSAPELAAALLAAAIVAVWVLTGHWLLMDGLGDIVMPGLLLCFVLRYDAYKKATLVCQMGQVPGPRSMGSRLTYFHCSLLGYFLGLLTATVSAEVFKAAQPALLYLVPFTLLPLLTMAYVKGDLRRMWSEPFIAPPTGKSGADFDV
ncbi:hypothetical protein HF086_005205 [Spodoptera exigua]|uniref:Signal peptide peptidase-like 3 n=1 Tax=Spodoptera exigua TaxID=7107 RepID=A0A922SQU5_SPOEX|nr:hypothetical protein HF086_005205 [Spodoptera exigua]